MPSSRKISPSNSLSTPARIFISVDLPAPFEPKMPIFAPRYMPRLMFLMSSFPFGVTLRTLPRERMIFLGLRLVRGAFLHLTRGLVPLSCRPSSRRRRREGLAPPPPPVAFLRLSFLPARTTQRAARLNDLAEEVPDGDGSGTTRRTRATDGRPQTARTAATEETRRDGGCRARGLATDAHAQTEAIAISANGLGRRARGREFARAPNP